MSASTCPHCGETLYGLVSRCFKCGGSVDVREKAEKAMDQAKKNYLATLRTPKTAKSSKDWIGIVIASLIVAAVVGTFLVMVGPSGLKNILLMGAVGLMLGAGVALVGWIFGGRVVLVLCFGAIMWAGMFTRPMNEGAARLQLWSQILLVAVLVWGFTQYPKIATVLLIFFLIVVLSG